MRFAICNELFEGWEFDRVCRFVKSAGYDGLEIAPFTLAPRITDVQPPPRRASCAAQAADAGVDIIGLHWLLAKTEGFYLTSPEPPCASDGRVPRRAGRSVPRPRRRPDGLRLAETALAPARRRSRPGNRSGRRYLPAALPALADLPA